MLAFSYHSFGILCDKEVTKFNTRDYCEVYLKSQTNSSGYFSGSDVPRSPMYGHVCGTHTSSVWILRMA